MSESSLPGLPSIKSFLKRSFNLFKIIGVTVLILLLLISLSMIDSVLQERLGRRNAAVVEITSSWGGTRPSSGRC